MCFRVRAAAHCMRAFAAVHWQSIGLPRDDAMRWRPRIHRMGAIPAGLCLKVGALDVWSRSEPGTAFAFDIARRLPKGGDACGSGAHGLRGCALPE